MNKKDKQKLWVQFPRVPGRGLSVIHCYLDQFWAFLSHFRAWKQNLTLRTGVIGMFIGDKEKIWIFFSLQDKLQTYLYRSVCHLINFFLYYILLLLSALFWVKIIKLLDYDKVWMMQNQI